MYIDDTAFYYTGNNTSSVSNALNEDTHQVYMWLCANKLNLHVGKTNSILICNAQKLRHLDSPNLDIQLDSKSIDQVEHLTYLGVEIDSRCNFNVYISNLVKKINRSIGVIKRCAIYLPLTTRKTLYNSLILPHIDYCSTVWSCTSQTNLIRLQRLQSRAMRVILRANPRTSIDDMLDKLRWMSVKQRLFYNYMILMCRIAHEAVPGYLLQFVKFAHEQHEHATRSATQNNLFIANGHKHSLFHNGALEWNSLPSDLRNIPKLPTFKNNLTKYVFSNCTRF